MDKNERIYIRLSSEEKDKLTAIAEYKNTSISDTVRTWINKVYARMEEKDKLS